MGLMRGDMGGAAAVAASVYAVTELQLPIRLGSCCSAQSGWSGGQVRLIWLPLHSPALNFVLN